MSVLSAVVMLHSLFLRSEVIQSQHFKGKGEAAIQERLRYEFADTLFSMIVGWAINSEMVILAAMTFFQQGIVVDDLAAADTFSPILGPGARLIFALALLFAGLSSSITAGMAAGTISAGAFGEEYDIHDRHSTGGIAPCFVFALVACLLVEDSFQGLLISQALLSLQLPIAVFLQIYLTSSSEIMGAYANSLPLKLCLLAIGIFVTVLDVLLML